MTTQSRERFFRVEAHIMNTGLRVLNWEKLGPPCITQGRYDLGGGKRGGLPHFPEPPKLEVRSKRRRSPPYDVEEVGSIWFVSDRFKDFAETVDPGAFDFVPCDNSQLLFDGKDLTFWACGAKRFGSFVDEAASLNLKMREDAPGWRTMLPLSSTRIAIDRNALGDAHIFSLIEWRNGIFCDEYFMRQYKAHKFRPLTFEPT